MGPGMRRPERQRCKQLPGRRHVVKIWVAVILAEVAFMTRLVLDSGTVARWHLTETTEVCDESGRTLGYFHPAQPGKDGMAGSPFSLEELERFREQRTGRPLGDILRDLETS